nr:hypothetical protein [Micromonospora rhizosphaerae]
MVKSSRWVWGWAAGAGDAQLGGEETERGQAEQGQQGEAEAGGQGGVAGGQPAYDSQAGAAGRAEDLAGAAERDGLAQAVAEDVQQHGGDRQPAAGGGDASIRL